MIKERLLPTQGFVDLHMARRAGDPLLAAQDMGNPHQMVIDDMRQVIGR